MHWNVPNVQLGLHKRSLVLPSAYQMVAKHQKIAKTTNILMLQNFMIKINLSVIAKIVQTVLLVKVQ